MAELFSGENERMCVREEGEREGGRGGGREGEALCMYWLPPESACTCVCVDVCACACVKVSSFLRLCVCVCLCVPMYLCMAMCLYASVCLCATVCLSVCLFSCVCVAVSVCAQALRPAVWKAILGVEVGEKEVFQSLNIFVRLHSISTLCLGFCESFLSSCLTEPALYLFFRLPHL